MVQPFMLTLIRHAKTKSNEERRYLGWSDEEILTQQLPVIDAKIKLVYGSDLLRCKHTAHAYFPKANYQSYSNFRESNFGDFEGKTYEDLQFNERYRQWIQSPMVVAPPNGETLEELVWRVRQGLEKIIEAEAAIVVLHGGSLRAILMEYSPEKSEFWDWSAAHEEKYCLTWPSFTAFKEGRRCILLSVEPLMENDAI